MRNRVSILLIALTLSLAACSPSLAVQSVCPSSEPIPVSEQAAARFETKVREAIAGEDTGSFALNVTSTEVTSFLALRSTDLLVNDVRIRFLPGRFCASGTTNLAGRQTGFSMLGSATLTNGQPHISVEAARLGPVSVPRFLSGRLATLANDQLQSLPANITVTELRLEADRVVLSVIR